MRINTEKFLQFVREQADAAKNREAGAKRDGEYERAIRERDERLTYEYLYNACTGSEETDIADFMEEE